MNKGDIVYWCHRRGHKYEVHWGMVDEIFSDAIYVDYLSVKERRRVDGIPSDEFESETKRKKLPKGWTYDTQLFEITQDEIENEKINIKDPENIKDLFNRGLLVKDSALFHGKIEADITKEGYRIVKKYPMWEYHISNVSIRPDRLYSTYEEAEKEVNENIAEFIRQSNLSEYEWSVEQIDKALDRWQGMYCVSEDDKLEHRNWLLEMENVEDIEVRLWGGNIQWKYWKKKRWNNIEL